MENKRKYKITIETGEEDIEDLILNKFKFDFSFRIIDIENVKKDRTKQQNSAMHLWFTQLAEALNEKHFDMRAIIKEGVDIEWSGYTVKEHLFKPLLKAKYGKDSTTNLLKIGEIDDLADIITKVIAERTNGECDYVPFPSHEWNREEK